MDDGLLLHCVEGLGDTPSMGTAFMATEGGIWNSLQSLKEEVSQDLLYEGSLCQSNQGGLEGIEVDAANSCELEWLHRSHLEARLRAITEAQDRLLEGSYGKCVDCGNEIYFGRLVADPAVSLCLDCQRIADGEEPFQ
jgi:DnaK suppressor protein